MTLVDTSVWIDHLRKPNRALSVRLLDEEVLVHPFVVGELACGTLAHRDEVLLHLRALPSARMARHEDVLHLVRERSLSACGIGWVDVHLLASALLSRAQLWTLDVRLDRVARRLGVSAPLHRGRLDMQQRRS